MRHSPRVTDPERLTFWNTWQLAKKIERQLRSRRFVVLDNGGPDISEPQTMLHVSVTKEDDSLVALLTLYVGTEERPYRLMSTEGHTVEFVDEGVVLDLGCGRLVRLQFA